jgi:endonuclease/exonuclease/phosphatase family metal-dependent hydrolase
MRIVTFNIKHGRAGTGEVDVPLLARTCAGFSADLLALQEVDRFARRSGFSDQVAVVARATGLSSAFGEAARRRPFRRYGNALFGRGKLDDVEVIGLPRPSAGEPRVAILARFEPEGPKLDGQSPGVGAPISVAATHLSFRKGEGPVQLEALLEALGRRRLPRVLLGDLNLGPEAVESALAAAGYQVAATAATFPVDEPRSRIDFIAVAGLELVGAEALPTPMSDHRPVVAEVGPRL